MHIRRTLWLFVCALSTAGGQAAQPAIPAGTWPAMRDRPQLHSHSAANLSLLPLCFEASGEKTDGSSRFLAHGLKYQFEVTAAGAWLSLDTPATQLSGAASAVRVVQIEFVGANEDAPLEGLNPMPGKINYLAGNDPSRWRIGRQTFSRVGVTQLYPGVDLVYYGNQERLEYDFTLAPRANPGLIRLRFHGADKVSINRSGELVLDLHTEEIRQPRPAIYQKVDGESKPITGGYRLRDDQTVEIAVGNYDPARPLVIDPFLVASTYFGGNRADNALAVALDAQTNVYVAGETLSRTFPFAIPAGSFQNTFQGGGYNGDAFVAKFDSTLSQLLYFTYLGGSASDGAYSIAVDAAGHAFVTGFTDSTNFPTTNAISPQIHGRRNRSTLAFPGDAFVAELETNGSSLIYSTYLGGSNVDVPAKITIDNAGDAFVTGYTISTDFPITTNAFPISRLSTNNHYAFVTEIAPNGTGFVYSSYLGGTNLTEGEGIAVYGTNIVFISGFTSSSNFPTTPGSFGQNLNGSAGKTHAFDGFLAKFDTSKSGSNSLLYSTYLGGINNDVATRVAVDGAGNAFVTGYSQSLDFPGPIFPVVFSQIQSGTVGPGQIQYFSVAVPEWARFATNWLTNATGPVNLLFNQNSLPTNGPPPDYQLLSQSQGGPEGDPASTFVISPSSTPPIVPGATYNLGVQNTNSTNVDFTLGIDFNAIVPRLATTVPGLHSGLNGASTGPNVDAFLAKFSFDSLGISNIQSVLFGGTSSDIGWDIAVETNSGNAYVVGITTSVNFPTTNTLGFLAATNSRHNDAFVTVVSNDLSGLVYSAYIGGRRDDFGYGIAVDPGGDAYIVGRTLSTNFPTVNPFERPVQFKQNGFVGKILLVNPLATVTIQTAPTDLLVVVDGVTNLAPVTFTNWSAGSAHTLSTIPVQDTNGLTYVWTNWSDKGTLTHTFIPLSNSVVTAGFSTPPPTAAAVVVDGKGTTSPKLSSTLQPGHTYSITAKPATGYLFAGWTLSLGTNAPFFTTNSPRLSFVMQEGLVIQASFLPNPFLPVKGNYAGLFLSTNAVTFTNSGAFNETLSANGSFSAKLRLAGKSYPFSGQFSTNGFSSNSVPRKGGEPLSVVLQLDFGNQAISGQVSDSTTTAELQANRAVFANTNPAPQSANRYTVVIPGNTNSAVLPGGNGFGTVTVNISGNLQFSGTLGDGTKVSQGTFVSALGQWPLYAPLYGGGGAILGWITFTNELTDDLRGVVGWFKSPQANSKRYPAGFTVETDLIGSIYSFSPGVPVLNFNPIIFEHGVPVRPFGPGPGEVAFQNGGLTQNFTNQIILGANNKVTNESPNKLTMSITTSTGLFHGNVVDPSTSKSISFNGAVLQKTNAGFGLFLGTDSSGTVTVGPR